jgi:hypothetical protein
MFKVTVDNKAGKKVADTRHDSAEKAQAFIDKHTAKGSWEPDAVATITDVTAEEQAKEAAGAAAEAKKQAALAIIKNTNPQAIQDPVLKAVVELLQ